MARPTPTTPYQEQLYAELAPLAYADEAAGWPLLKYCGAIASMFDQIDTYVSDREDMPGWAILFDPDLCPPEALPWLANCGGVTFTVGMSVAEQRVAIKSLGGRKRGGVDSVAAAAAQYLSGTKSVYIRESDVPFKTQMQTFNYDGTDSGIPQLDAAGGGGNATISTEEGCLRVNMGASAGLAAVYSSTGQFGGGPMLVLPNQFGTQYNAPCISILLRMRSILGTANVTGSIRLYDASFNYLGSQDLTTQVVQPHNNFQNFVYPITGSVLGFYPTAYYFVPSFKCSDAGVQFYVDQMSTRYGTFSQVIFGGSDPYFVSVSVKQSELPESDQPMLNQNVNPKFKNNTNGWTEYFTAGFTRFGATGRSALPSGEPAWYEVGSFTANQQAGIYSNGMSVVPGGTYTAGYDWVCDQTTTDMFVKNEITFFNSGGGQLAGGGFQVSTGGTVAGQRMQQRVSAVAPAGAAYAIHACYLSSGATPRAIGTFFTSFMFTDHSNAPAGTYGDGDTPGWFWNGTPGNSSSSRTPTSIVENAIRAQKPAGIILTFYTLQQPSYQAVKNVVPDYGSLAGGGWTSPFTYAGLAAQTY